MSGVRVLVGTRKGAFILTSDGSRKGWKVEGPHFAGWEIYHLKASPADPNRIYASQSSGWFGQVLQRSNDGGKSWETAGNQFQYEGTPGTHRWYDGSPHPWEFKRVWHLEPSLSDPDKVYAGVEDAALFQTRDGGNTWTELAGLRTHQLVDVGIAAVRIGRAADDEALHARRHVAVGAAGAVAEAADLPVAPRREKGCALHRAEPGADPHRLQIPDDRLADGEVRRPHRELAGVEAARIAGLGQELPRPGRIVAVRLERE